MQFMNVFWQPIPLGAALLLTLLAPQPASAQVSEAVVGITSTCPYGLKGCWAGAYEALKRLDNVVEVEPSPDTYNCTARLQLKEGVIPDPQKWAEQFKSHVDQAYIFRGIEVAVEGTLARNDQGLTLQVPGLEQPIALRPLEHKLQWNSKKGAARQPEPDERDAYDQLSTRQQDSSKNQVRRVQVVGPLLKTKQGLTVEVREFFPRANPPSE